MSRDQDPTLIRNQPALRGSHGREWIVVGAVLAALCALVLLAQVPIAPAIALLGTAIVVVLYVAMVVVRVAVRPLRQRLLLLAMLLTLIAAFTLVSLLAVLASVS